MRVAILLFWLSAGVFSAFGQSSAKNAELAANTSYDYKAVESPTAYVGIGVQIHKDRDTDWMYVRKVLNNGPAEKAGLQKGDFITKVNGHAVMPLSLDELANHLIGPKGSEVTLVIMRDHKFITLKITRAPIIF